MLHCVGEEEWEPAAEHVCKVLQRHPKVPEKDAEVKRLPGSSPAAAASSSFQTRLDLRLESRTAANGNLMCRSGGRCQERLIHAPLPEPSALF